VESMVDTGVAALEAILREGIAPAMNEFNRQASSQPPAAAGRGSGEKPTGG
jgi:hypothetical protein